MDPLSNYSVNPEGFGPKKKKDRSPGPKEKQLSKFKPKRKNNEIKNERRHNDNHEKHHEKRGGEPYVPLEFWDYATFPLDPARREIRLLRLLDVEDYKPSCIFSVYSLDDCPPYAALSYMWHDSSATKIIKLGEKELKVTKNLWSFLRRANSMRGKLFWIDALCIHQADTNERNHQVALMRNIYSKAAEVAVWLGPGNDDDMSAMDALYACFVRSSKKRGSEPNWTEAQGKAILKLFERRYWRRVWIVQEFILGKNVNIYCGNRAVPGIIVDALFFRLQDLATMETIESVPFGSAIYSSPAALIIHQRREWHRLPDHNKGFELRYLLEAYQYSESSEARDKLYGLLSLTQESQLKRLGISADYSKSAFDIYQHVLTSYYMQTPMQRSDVVSFAKMLHKSLGYTQIDLSEDPALRGILQKTHSHDMMSELLDNEMK